MDPVQELFTPQRLARSLAALGVEAALDPRDGRLFAELARLYRSPERHYHSDVHVAECLRALDEHRELAERPEEVELAIWFHDAIYDTGRDDNEEASARLAEERLGAVGIACEAIGRIAQLIRWTQKHDARGRDGELLIDIDLGILGQSRTTFERYDAEIRAEYAWVPESAYRNGRARVLRSFLERERIYRTAAFHSAYEQPARDNLQAKLRELEGES
ncbi:MAG: HD domain-containing protein [Planctomycetota bacterium]|jgi:predicted metal-dependent HD superfamily phosphohydrolase